MQWATPYPSLYRLLKPIFPSCLWSGDRHSPQIALTFDDGPHPQYTPKLLDVLDRYGIPATFFWIGTCVEQTPDIVQAACKRGHGMGLHGYDHHPFPLLTPEALQQSLEKTQRAIAQACQLNPQEIRDVRPPNGLFTPQTLDLLQQWNYRAVMWSVVPEDWRQPGVSVVVERVLRQVENGSLIVLHDGACGGPDVVEIAVEVIPQLQSRGYEFVTVNQLATGIPVAKPIG